jgi:hypothetical protein
MQIPKQPRTKSSARDTADDETASSATTESGSASETRAAGADADADVNKTLQDAYSSYVASVNSAHLQAQLEQAKAYLAYLESLQQQVPNPASDPTLAYWQSLVKAPDMQAMADAQKTYALASADHQANSQKAVADAATAYSQNTREIWEKLQGEVERHNQNIAEQLKNALLKIDVSPAHLPALSLLYQGLRSMSTTADRT